MGKNKKSIKVLAVIPARGGSKGLPGKNIRPLSGKTLIGWSIALANNCPGIDRLIVSTEDHEIARIARKLGAEVPFMRPAALATDQAQGIDVVLHAIDWAQRQGEGFDVLLLLQPTSPLRAREDIGDSLRMLKEGRAKSVVSVCPAEHSPLWSNTLPKDHCMKDFIGLDVKNKNRQDSLPFYRLNGAIFAGFFDYIKENKSFFGKKTFAHIMPPERSVDIDSPLDLDFAEFLIDRFPRRKK